MAEREGPSRQSLDDIHIKTLKFLHAVGTHIPIRAALATKGYDDGDHAEGWELLHAVSGFGVATPGAVVDVEVRGAIAELDSWDEPNFRIIRAALERRHPEQAAFVFANLEPAKGAGAVLSVGTLLDRLDALEKDPERKATRKADHAALATLAKRGVTEDERARLRVLVERARRGTAAPAAPAPATKAGTEREASLVALYGWHKEWSEVAKSVIHRRDWLVGLGLAQRRKAERAPKAPKPDEKPAKPDDKPPAQ